MSRPLDVFLPLPRDIPEPAETFRASPATWLPAPAVAADGGGWLIDVQAGPVTATVTCAVADAREGEETTWRRLRWTPDGDGQRHTSRRLLPVLDAQLGLAQDNSGGWSLVLTGSYDPPAAWLGEVADSIVLHRVARATLQHFLVDVARRMNAS